MGNIEYRKFPGGARCDQCPTRYYYLEDGFRYCKNGHQVQGYRQLDVDEEAEFGKGGKASRKKKERVEKVAKHLSGNAARELYVECLQLVLRRELAWLVARKDLPGEELEAVVRALFALRLRRVAGLRSVAEAKGKGKGKGKGRDWDPYQSQSQSESDGSHLVFSSMDGEGALSSDAGPRERRASKNKRHWSGDRWDPPALIDTLALCYLGCLLLRQPVRVGDIYRWAKAGQLPYLGAVDLIPKASRDRLPGWAQSALQARNTTFNGSDLHRAIKHLTSGYSKNFGMKFPALNWSPILLKYLWDLALPPDVHKYTEYVVILLKLVFTWPTQYQIGDTPADTASKRAARRRLLADPDLLLVSCMVFATKYLYPLDGIERSPESATDPLTLKMDWAAWQRAFHAAEQDAENKKPDYENVRPSDVWSMTDRELDAFLDAFQERKIEEKEDATEIERLFPLKALAPTEQSSFLPAAEDASDFETEQRNVAVNEAMTSVPPHPDPDSENHNAVAPRRIGDRHQIYRHVEDLAGPAEVFYREAARVAGLSVKDLVRGVYSVEMLWAERRIWEKRMVGEGAGSDG